VGLADAGILRLVGCVDMMHGSSVILLLAPEVEDHTGTAQIDFVNNLFVVEGATVAAADIIDNPGLIDPAGLLVAEFDTPVEIIGPLLTVLLMVEWTIVLEVEVTDLAGAVWLLSLCDLPVDGTNSVLQVGIDTADDMLVYDDAGPGAARSVNGGAVTLGMRRVAISREDSRLSISVDGAATVTGAGSISLSNLTNATFGNFTDDFNARDAYIRTIDILAIQDDDTLPLLSAP
jgi:hypothetical protein